MTTSNATLRIGPVEHGVLRALDRTRQRVWRVKDKVPVGMTRLQQRKALHHLTAAGLLDRIERGTYLVLPRSGRIMVPPLELVGSWFSDEPHSVVGHAAAEFHRLTFDTSQIVEVQLGRVKKPVEFQGVRYVFSKPRKSSLVADNVKVEAGQAATLIASPGKIMVLLLNQTSSRRSERPTRDTRFALEVLDTGIARGIWASSDWPRLVRRHGNSFAARRLGYLLERSFAPGAEALIPLRGSAGNALFSPIYPADGPVNTRWRLILNDPIVR